MIHLLLLFIAMCFIPWLFRSSKEKQELIKHSGPHNLDTYKWLLSVTHRDELLGRINERIPEIYSWEQDVVFWGTTLSLADVYHAICVQKKNNFDEFIYKMQTKIANGTYRLVR